jgi:hypothetical protein
MLRCFICLLFLSEDLYFKDRMVLCVDSTNTTTAADITTSENGGNCSISRLLLFYISFFSFRCYMKTNASRTSFKMHECNRLTYRCQFRKVYYYLSFSYSVLYPWYRFFFYFHLERNKIWDFFLDKVGSRSWWNGFSKGSCIATPRWL